MDEPAKISAVVITFNEEINIEKCLISLKTVADEIIVVDSFSTDKTLQICGQLKVRIIQNQFAGHIEQKNFAVNHASYDVILSLDADEVLSARLAENIIKIKHNWHADAFQFNRLTNYCGQWIRHGGWYPDTKIRLWDKRKGKWAGTNPHDRVVMEKDAIVKSLPGDLLHYSYHSIKQHIDQVNYFTSIMSREAYVKRKKTNLAMIIFSPWFKFIKSYIFKLGFLDGYFGFVICMISAHATFLKHVKLKELSKLVDPKG